MSTYLPGLGVIETSLLIKLTRFVGDDVNYNIIYIWIYIYMDIYGASDRNSLLKKQRITWDRFFLRNDFSLGHHMEPSDGLDRHRSRFITVMALYQL